MDWYLYIIRCDSGVLYTGITTDVERRFKEHSEGAPKGAKFLRGKGPLELVVYKKVGSKSEASKLEYKVKRLPKLEKLNFVEKL